MVSSTQIMNAVQTLVTSAERLCGSSFPHQDIENLLNLSSILTLRKNMGPNRPIFAGLIGCTGTGKSTVFNSLANADISLTGWRAHNTNGPVVITHTSFFQALDIIEKQYGKLFLSQFPREAYRLDTLPYTNGTPEKINLIASNDSLFHKLVLFDLPDINTTLSREENLLAYRLQPWLDVVIFVVDDESIYHRDYEYPAQLAKELHQSTICILNHRGRDRVDLNHPDIQTVKSFFGVDSIYLFPELINKTKFDEELSYLQFKNALTTSTYTAPDSPWLRKISSQVSTLLEENLIRTRYFNSLEQSLSKLIDDFLTKEQPIPLEKVLDDEVLQILQHLGLKRFSVTNVYHFLKRTVTTGSLRKSFQLSFGEKRDRLLSRVFRPDMDKMTYEIHDRLSGYKEKIAETVRRTENSKQIMEIAPELKAFPALEKKNKITEPLNQIVSKFEKTCKGLISTDTISSSLKNDPLVTVVLSAALVADTFTIPGFGSWLLVPSAFKYLPLGKFEKIKRQFQSEIQDIMRHQLSGSLLELQAIRNRVVLDRNDSLTKVLKICSEYE